MELSGFGHSVTPRLLHRSPSLARLSRQSSIHELLPTFVGEDGIVMIVLACSLADMRKSGRAWLAGPLRNPLKAGF